MSAPTPVSSAGLGDKVATQAKAHPTCFACRDVGVKDGKIVGVRGLATDRVNKGRLGPKGMLGWETNHHPDRLTHPMIRKNGKLERASWDEAMSLIVKKTKEVQHTLSSHGIGFYTSGQLFLEEVSRCDLFGNFRACSLPDLTEQRPARNHSTLPSPPSAKPVSALFIWTATPASARLPLPLLCVRALVATVNPVRTPTST